MTRLEKISGVLDHFGRPILNRVGVSRGVRAEVIIGIVLVLSTMALGLGVSIMSARSLSSESMNASARETPPITDLSTASATAAEDVKDAPLGQVPVDVIAPVISAQAGTDIQVPITVSDTTNLQIGSWQGDILYDPAVLLPMPLSATLTGSISNPSGSLTVNPFQSGRIKMAFFDAQGLNLAGAGVLVTLRFVVVGPIGSTSPLTWERNPGSGRLVFQFNGGTPASNIVDGQVNIVVPAGPTPVGATPVGTPIVGVLQVGDTTRDNRLLRNSIFAGCATKTCPGSLGLYPVATLSPTPTATATGTPGPTPFVVTYPPGINTYRYDVIPFTNSTGQAQNFTFTTTVTGPGSVLPAIYAQPYNPTGATCLANYRGDPGGSAVPGGPVSFSVNIPAGATYDLVIEGDQPIVSATPAPPLPPINAAPAVVPYTVVVTIPNCLGVVTATNTATPTNTATSTATLTNTATPSATLTFTPSATSTSTFTPSATSTSTFTPSATSTSTFTPTPTSTSTFTATNTSTPTFTPTFTPSSTSTATASSTATFTATSTVTSTPTATFTSTSTATATATATSTPLGCPQNFDTASVPNLPVGWTTVASSGNSVWVTSTVNPDSPTIDAYGAASTTAGTSQLLSPFYTVTASSLLMTFRNAFNFQDAGSTSGVGFDGMVLEISINGAAFQDIIASGGSFVTGGYNKTISGATGSPIANRMAWSGLSGATTAVPAYITTTVNLPPAANGQLVRIRWLVASDSGTVAAGDQGARIDTIIGTACGATAAAAAISGRVMTADGLGIRNARVVITGNALSEPRIATTGSFGWFSIDGLQTGETYVVTVNSQRYTFSTPSRVISLVDNVVDANFIANPQE